MDLIVFDLSKAFVRNSHEKVFLKLESYGVGVTDVRMIGSYLINWVPVQVISN